MYVTSDMAIYLVEMKKYQIGYFRLKRTVQFPYGRKKKKEREKKKIRDTFCRTRIGGKIVLSICLHRVFKMQSPIRLSISPPASFRVYSTLSPARANTNTPLYSSASMMKPCRRCARTHVTAHTHRRKTRLITFSASFPLSPSLSLSLCSRTRSTSLLFMHVCTGQVDVY